jgi:hypothetical protein
MPSELVPVIEATGLPETLKALNALYLEMRKGLIEKFPGGDGYFDTQRTIGGKYYHLQFGWYDFPPRSKT